MEPETPDGQPPHTFDEISGALRIRMAEWFVKEPQNEAERKVFGERMIEFRDIIQQVLPVLSRLASTPEEVHDAGLWDVMLVELHERISRD